MFGIAAIVEAAPKKIVRVGYIYSKGYQEGHNDSEPKSGYGYEYLQRLAAHTNWEYQYVYGTFPQLLEMLEDGKLDLMGDISYTEERSKRLIYSNQPMGYENYNLYTEAKRMDIDPDNLESINGLRISVNKNSYQQELLERWLLEHNLSCKIVLTDDDRDEDAPIKAGESDLCAAVDTSTMSGCYALAYLGSSPYYFAMPKDRDELMNELNAAQSAILKNTPRFSQMLDAKYYKTSNSVNGLTKNEYAWLKQHKELTVGYFDGYAPFCYTDQKTGKMAGIAQLPLDDLVKDFNVTLKYRVFGSMEDMEKSLQAGEIDIATPVLNDLWLAEKGDYISTDNYSNTRCVLFKNHQVEEESMAVCYTDSMQHQFMYLHYPNVKYKTYGTYSECVKAVEKGEVQFTVLNGYQYERFLNRHKLSDKVVTVVLPLGGGVAYAVSKESPALASILNKKIATIDASRNSDMIFAAVGVADKDAVNNLAHKYKVYLEVLVIAFLALLAVAIYKAKSLKDKARKSREWEYKAKHDVLTGLYNRQAYECCMRRMREEKRSAYFLILDIDNFKDINDEYGHDCGDRLLQRTATVLKSIAGPKDAAFRFGGDEFIVIAMDVDKTDEKFLTKKYVDLSNELAVAGVDVPAVHISAGACFVENGENEKAFHIADLALYHTKNNGGNGYAVMDNAGQVVLERYFHNSAAMLISKSQLYSDNKAGGWQVELVDGKLPRLYCDDVMLKMIGASADATPEECYELWYNNVDKDDVELITKVSEEFRCSDHVESTYRWHHHKLGIQTIRGNCTIDRSFEGGLCIYGFIQNISDLSVVTKDDDSKYIVNALNDMYLCNYYIDLNTRRYTAYKKSEHMSAYLEDSGTFDELKNVFINKAVSSNSQKDMQLFLSGEDMQKRLKYKYNLECEYELSGAAAWRRARIFPVKHDRDGNVTSILLVVFSLDNEKRLQLAQNKQMEIIRRADEELVATNQLFLGMIDVSKRTMLRLYSEDNLPSDTGRDEVEYDVGTEFAIEKVILPKDRERARQIFSLEHIIEMLDRDKLYRFTMNTLRDDGSLCLYAYSYSYYNDDHNRIIAKIEDITARDEIDNITEDVNMNGFIRKAGYVINNIPGGYAIIHFDIQGFKGINEQIGFYKGNLLLKAVHDYLKQSFLEPLALTRDLADHFYMLVDKKRIDYKQLTALCKHHHVIRNVQILVNMNCGIYMVDDKSLGIRSMCDRARLAENELKKGSAQPYYVFTEEMQQAYKQKQKILGFLDSAVKNNEFHTYFQPVYNAVTKKIASAEALVRWIRTDGSIVVPDVFIPTLEENGQISRIDLIIEDFVQKFNEKRSAAGKFFVPVSINLSRMDFYNEEVLEQLLRAVKNAKIPKEYLRFEVTESAYANVPDHGVKALQELRELGCKLLVDDFGKGVSSLSSLTEQHFDIVKLDMSFTRQIGINKRAEAVIISTISMTHLMDGQVIAEGVESEEQYLFLKEHGCDYIQGYYFSKPITASDFEALLDSAETNA